jgi:hypothetical protein
LPAPAMQARLESVRARGVAAATLVRIRYAGEERRVRPYVVEGKVYFFGNTERRREGVVPARVAWQFLEKGGRFYGSFEVVESGDAGAAGDAESAGDAGDVGAEAQDVAQDETQDVAQDETQDVASLAAAGGVMPRKGGGKRGG